MSSDPDPNPDLSNLDSEWIRQGYFERDTYKPAMYVLQRRQRPNGEDAPGAYILLHPIRYIAADGRREWVKPREGEVGFETDLASIPALASWLVPKDGSHTPAALIHDSMVGERHYDGPEVQRDEADRVFREGMQYLGVPLIRRWMMWTAVSIPTLAGQVVFDSGKRDYLRPYRVLLIVVGFIVFGVLGVLGMPDVMDVPGDLPIPSWLPLIGGKELRFELWNLLEEYRLLPVNSLAGSRQAFRVELGWLIVFVAVAASCYGVLWGKHFRFGSIFGFALAFVALPVAILGIAYGIYRLIEILVACPFWIASRLGLYNGRVSFR
jgi:hypothetical protein